MDWVGIIIGIAIGIIGVAAGILSYLSTKKIEKKLISEKEMILDRILDIQQLWKGYRDRIINDRETFNDPTRNQLDIQIRIEDIETQIENLERFAVRLRKLS